MTCTGIINMCIQNTLANQECDMYCIKKLIYNVTSLNKLVQVTNENVYTHQVKCIYSSS